MRETQADSHIFSTSESRQRTALQPQYIFAIEVPPSSGSGLSARLLEVQRERESEKLKYALLKDRLAAKIVECRELRELVQVTKPAHFR